MKYICLAITLVALLSLGHTSVVNAADEEMFVPQTSSTRTDVPSPPRMPETGAGNIAGAFASVSISGYVAHRVILRRRTLTR